ncbi:MAG: hypothetical protein J1E63_07815 [Muribaculaceae bacterium]|nr:hypothetical protein [Muribaculaceae bacterium]
MKKNLFAILAASTMLLSSCVQEGIAPTIGEEADVLISLTTPQIGTRDYSDGTTATNLQYAVYDVTNTDEIALLDKYTVTDATINTTANIKFKLVNGHTYRFVFWAQSPETDAYTVDFGAEGATMTVDYTKTVANDETLDAFYVCEDLAINGDIQKTFELRRPFAQINVGTNDYEEAEAVGYVPTKSYIVITGAPNQLNLFTGEVSTTDERTYAYGEIQKDEKFPVDGYQYLAMAYVLAPQEANLHTVAFYWAPEGGTPLNRQIGSVPTRANYRTNIYGSILTNEADVTVVIEPAYYEPDYNMGEFNTAVANGGNITLSSDQTVDQDLVFRKESTLNLNGYTLTTNNSTLTLASSAKVTINGGGTVAKVGEDYYGSTAAAYVNGASAVLTINGGNFTSTGVEAVYVQVGTAYINGGYFAAANDYNGVYYTLNCADANFKNGTAKIIVTGGTFENFNPADTEADKTDGKNGNLVAEGYKSVKVNLDGKTCYTVVPEWVNNEDVAGYVAE